MRDEAEPPITRADVNAIMLMLMKIDATLERIELRLEGEDGEEEELEP